MKWNDASKCIVNWITYDFDSIGEHATIWMENEKQCAGNQYLKISWFPMQFLHSATFWTFPLFELIKKKEKIQHLHSIWVMINTAECQSHNPMHNVHYSASVIINIIPFLSTENEYSMMAWRHNGTATREHRHENEIHSCNA